MGLKEKIVDEIINDISDRKGIGDEWYCIDEDIQDEIKEEWQQLVNEELEKESDLKQEILDALIETRYQFTFVDELCKIAGVHEYSQTKKLLDDIIQKSKELDN